MDEPSPEALRAREFTIARKGYDRGEVEAFKAEVAAAVALLQADIERLNGVLHQAGFDYPRDLASELESASADVARILDAARSAAQDMRSRAGADATRWRAEADAEARETIDEATDAAQALRSSAWDEGTALLEAAAAEYESIIDVASQDALFIRAEAEREALRLTSDARRERDEELRRMREEGERLLGTARQEADTLLGSARHQADTAQERARALEARRAELMAELEAARASIGMLESEIETKQRVLEPVEHGDGQDSVEGAWPVDEGSVRVVSGTRAVRSHPVDALEIAAEVEALQRPQPEPVPEPAAAQVLEPEPVLAAAPEPAPVPEPTPELLSEPQPVLVSAPAPEPIPETAPEPAPEPEATHAAASGTAADDISGLFASLRLDVPKAPEPTPEPEPKPELIPPEPAPAEPHAAEHERERRDRLLLPVQNRALRGVKRNIVDLQNRCLEELRVDGSWIPDEALFGGAFDDDLAAMARESMVAGFAAAREVAGVSETPHPSGVSVESPADEFVAALVAAVRAALERSRGAGTSARDTASGLSRVFRTWRTDEAERRVRLASEAAFDRGFRAALETLGVTV